ncbi:ABC transporter permease [Xanthovirga aplysinae]|uniref:ABC transporter permease n=1 Tax=Xanthovirga aplysinae TaxID=2529853 RepID=UPI0012BBA8C1|nr:ABC transporter permease [Xanthovirga aplysinae]MTI31301.1 ABC transporter permease [Xanthovirga aplysinae]
MIIVENIKEGLRSIQGNLLRTILTALIVAIGITALVGILTAIDGIQASVSESFASLGGNSFEIKSKSIGSRRNQGGKAEKVFPRITFRQAKQFRELSDAADVTVSTVVTRSAEVKYSSKKSNPNLRIYGGDVSYLGINGYNLEKGRNFSEVEDTHGVNVAIIGEEVENVLFEDNEDPINKSINFLGGKYRVIGLLEKQGSFGGGSSGADRSILIPIENANRLLTTSQPDFRIDVAINLATDMSSSMGEATGLMRSIRKDSPGEENSFELERNQTVEERLSEITGYLRVGGFAIGLITLLGASIGLMNIMMVTVTERTREIGVRKALGATPTLIRQQFLMEAIVICLLGGIGGVVFGLLIGNLVSSVLNGVFVVPWFWMLLGLIICVVVGVLSGYYPARKASRFDPIESLRFE